MKRFEEADRKLAQQTKAQNLDVSSDLFKVQDKTGQLGFVMPFGQEEQLFNLSERVVSSAQPQASVENEESGWTLPF